MNRNRDDQGQYIEKMKGETVLEALDEADDPVMTVTEIAGKLGVSGETARRRLNELHEQGKVQRKEVGARAVVWWRKPVKRNR